MPVESVKNCAVPSFVAIAVAIVLVGAAPTPEPSAFAPPSGWVRTTVDAAHAGIAPRVRTVEAWIPSTTSPAAHTLFYAVGDGVGTTLDAYIAVVKAALPADASITEEKSLALCDGQSGHFVAFQTPKLAIEETIAIGGSFAAVARYERTAGSAESPDARTSVQSICPQAEAPPSD